MPVSNSELLTAQFYEWEQVGRGWTVFDSAIELEPQFQPFFFHQTPPANYLDDGKRPGFFESLSSIFKIQTPPSPPEKKDLPKAFKQTDDEKLVATSTSLPEGYKIRTEEMEQLLLMISYSTFQISFEIIADSTTIRLQFVTRISDQQLLIGQLKAYFPICICASNYKTDDIINGELDGGTITDFGLNEEFMRPLLMVKSFDLDPFIGLFGILEHLQGDDRVVLQILFKGTVNPWSESIIRSVMDDSGGAFFLDAPEMQPLAKEKISCPLFGVTVRVLTQSTTQEQARSLSDNMSNAIIRFSASNVNRLVPLSSEGYDTVDYVSDLMERKSHRLGMLLNSRELATLVHLPSSSVVSAKLIRERKKTKEAPKVTEGNEFILGTNIHQGNEKSVSINAAQRLKHTHIIGATGTGKSTFLLNLIAQDIYKGNGICCIDPHGDLIENILQKIPQERIQDVVLIDPADSEYPVGFNILKAHSDIEKEILSSDLVAAFKRLSTSWGDQMNSVFANAILAFLESSEAGTLMDLRRFLIEKSFRDSFLKTVTDSHVVYYWQKEFPILKSNSIGPILTRLDTFLRPRLIRNMIMQKKGLDFEGVLDSKKILLMKLSQGLIGNENSYLLGTFIVSKIHQAAMARQAKAKEARSDFFVYIDEFQNFITPSMSAILSGARKYHMGLILAHQDMQQLIKYDSELASSVVANAGTRICFRLGDTDAKKFESGFSYFDANDLQSLNVGEAIARVDRPAFDFNLTVVPFETQVKNHASEVIEFSRTTYGTPRSEIESAFLPGTEADVISNETTTSTEKYFDPEKHQPIKPLTEKKKQETINSISDSNALKAHRYLQSFIKKMAESRGYKATIEEPTPDGKGRVDVSLERNNKKIACEITVTTTESWEVHNVQKCLTAGYEMVVVCSIEKSNLEKVRMKCATVLSIHEQQKVRFFEPADLFLYLDEQIAKEASTEVRLKGYRVKVNYSPVTEEEVKQKKENILRAVTESIRSKNKK